jgi:hypothetical protein
MRPYGLASPVPAVRATAPRAGMALASSEPQFLLGGLERGKVHRDGLDAVPPPRRVVRTNSYRLRMERRWAPAPSALGWQPR